MGGKRLSSYHCTKDKIIRIARDRNEFVLCNKLKYKLLGLKKWSAAYAAKFDKPKTKENREWIFAEHLKLLARSSRTP